jgi:membrane-associated phospholipid phosphatase
VPDDLRLADQLPRPRHYGAIVAAAFAVAFIIAIFLDIPLSAWAHDSGVALWLKNHVMTAHAIRFPGRFYYTIVICGAMLIAAWAAGFKSSRRLRINAAIVFLAGILSGLNAPIKIIVGRIRPYHGVPPFELHPFSHSVLTMEAGFSFPSGDMSLAVAMAMSLSMTVPRLRPLWWTLAVIVGLERIAENAHYPSDVVAGAALGVAVAILARWIVGVLIKNDENHNKEATISSHPASDRTI